MNDIGSREISAAGIQDRLVREFVAEAREELDRMKADKPGLEALRAEVWRRTWNSAHNIAARAGALRLGVLQRCALELEHFSSAFLEGNTAEQIANLEMAMIAIATIELELALLQQQAERSG